jgi:hypothetical protein
VLNNVIGSSTYYVLNNVIGIKEAEINIAESLTSSNLWLKIGSVYLEELMFCQ